MPRPDRPSIQPLGESALLLRFGDSLSEEANRAAIVAAGRIAAARIAGVTEVAPNLVSVLVRYDARAIGFARLSQEISLVWDRGEAGLQRAVGVAIAVRFDGPDLSEVADHLGVDVTGFVSAHNASPLRVLSVGFAPGFIYCGFHPDTLRVPRRQQVRRRVEAGAVLFAAGQTAIASTPIPTGWHVIGHTDFSNFSPNVMPPSRLSAGDLVRFEVGS